VGIVSIENGPDGRPHVTHDPSDGTLCLLTGPVTGEATMADGTVYDFTPAGVAVQAVHAGEAVHAYEMKLSADNRLKGALGLPHEWEHVCTEECGTEAQ
jgi:hypothetical protein